MLARLSIRDIVLIDKLDIDFSSGLSVLTGETGAGKSILLDAFALALGARGDASLVRQGAEQGQVTAMFELPANQDRPRRWEVISVLRSPDDKRVAPAQVHAHGLFTPGRKNAWNSIAFRLFAIPSPRLGNG